MPTQPHHLDSDEICIQETIGKFYIFFQKLVTLKSEIERLGDIDEHTRARVLDQLDDIESEDCESERMRGFDLHCVGRLARAIPHRPTGHSRFLVYRHPEWCLCRVAN